MEALTLIFALISTVAIFCSKPIYSLIVYIAVLAWYPSYLAVSVGTVGFTLRRIVIMVIFANLFLHTSLPGRFKFIWLDKIMIIYFCCQVLAGATTTQTLMAFLENRAGGVFDMVLPYFAVRLIITNRDDYLRLLKGILIIAAPLAIIGFYQCLTGENLVGFLKGYGTWEGRSYVPVPRLGFFRADVVFSHSIMYGLFFAMLGPICAGILGHAKKYRMLCWMGLGLMGIGIFSSMSSGPILAGLLSILFISFYRWRAYWKPIVITIIIMCGSVEFISNRHFYDVLGGFTLNPATAWYRSKLIDVALFEGGMSGHWLTGFGQDVDPGWKDKIDGGDHTDIVNHYLLILSRYGLIGLIPFLAMVTCSLKRLINAYKISISDTDKYLVWCLAGALYGLLGSLFSVSLFGQPTTIFYVMLGLCGAMPTVVSYYHSRKTAFSIRYCECKAYDGRAPQNHGPVFL